LLGTTTSGATASGLLIWPKLLPSNGSELS